METNKKVGISLAAGAAVIGAGALGWYLYNKYKGPAFKFEVGWMVFYQSDAYVVAARKEETTEAAKTNMYWIAILDPSLILTHPPALWVAEDDLTSPMSEI